MPNDLAPLSSSHLPMDGSVLTTAIPPVGAPAQVTLTGTLTFAHTGQVLDGAHADRIDPQLNVELIRIEPGDWHLVAADPAAHRYTYAPVGPYEGSATVQLNVDGLVDRFLEAPSTIRQSLSGDLTVALVPVAPPIPTAGSAWVEVAGLGLVGVAALLLVGRALGARRARNADVRVQLARIRGAARAIAPSALLPEELAARAGARVPQLVATAEQLATSIQVLRRRLEKAGMSRIDRELERLRSTGATPDRLADHARLQELLRPMKEEEHALLERLRQIGTTLEIVRVAWVTLTPSSGREEATRAGELLETVDREVSAAVVTRQELQRF